MGGDRGLEQLLGLGQALDVIDVGVRARSASCTCESGKSICRISSTISSTVSSRPMSISSHSLPS